MADLSNPLRLFRERFKDMQVQHFFTSPLASYTVWTQCFSHAVNIRGGGKTFMSSSNICFEAYCRKIMGAGGRCKGSPLTTSPFPSCQCKSWNSPWIDPSILGHSGIRGAADEAALKKVHEKLFYTPRCFLYGCSAKQKNIKYDLQICIAYCTYVVQLLYLSILCYIQKNLSAQFRTKYRIR